MAQQHLIEHLQEELHDVESYMEMYHETECGIYKDLAYDEMSHAKILKEKCKDEGVDLTPYMEQWNHAENLLHK